MGRTVTDHRPVYYPPSPNLGYKPPTFGRILRTLSSIIGWIILVPATVLSAICSIMLPLGLLFTLFAGMEVEALIGWVAITIGTGMLLSLGLLLTGKWGPWHA